MAIAGKVAITLKGDWNNTTTYEKLDAVTYNNGLYIAKKASTGVTPVNGDTWMLSVQSVDAIEFEKIIDGTTVVGKATNANTADTLNAETADLENIKTTFTEATTRTNINSKETLGTLFGKIKKWFTDLKTVAFTGSYNDLSDTPTIPSVGNGTITITQAGVTKGSFTTNQTGNTTISLTDDNTTYSTATQSANGLMSASDKSKLDGIATGANAYTLPSATSSTLGGVKTTDSSAVTDSTGLALAATEKNASISGTLANQISTLNNNLNEIFLTAKGNVGDKYLQNTTIYDYLSALPSNYRYALFTSSGSGYGVTDYPVDGWFNYFCFSTTDSNQWTIIAVAQTFDAFYVGHIYNGAITWKKVY